MKAPFATIIAFLVFQISHSQNVIKVNVQDSLSKEALIGVDRTFELDSYANECFFAQAILNIYFYNIL